MKICVYVKGFFYTNEIKLNSSTLESFGVDVATFDRVFFVSVLF